MIEVDELVKQASALADADKPDEAIALTDRVLWHEPDNYKALFVAGSVFLKAGRNVQAMQLLKRVVELRPKSAQGWGQLALCAGEMHRYDESIAHAERALSIRREAKTLSDCAYAHINAGNWAKGEQLAIEALKLDPALHDAHVHIANVLLAKGDWARGFPAYRITQRTKFRKEWRYEGSVEWQGEADAIVMVTGEQGLGDEIMAASVVPDAAKACKRFILDCDERLAGLFRRSFPDVLVTGTRRSATVTLPVMPTHHKTLFGLGELFRRQDADFPRRAYLQADPDLRRMFRALFDGRPVIGLSWSGGLPRTGQAERAAGLTALLPLLRRGGEFVSLQYKDDAAEVAEVEKQHGVKVRRLPWVTQAPDMDLLAALIAECAEVVGVHTTALHLSSALGVPTTALVHRGSGWRYVPQELLWYPPTTQMHRKRTGESWRECVGRLMETRKERLAA